MAAPGGNLVYATLLLNDTYLPGALVLAHSLRDAGTRIKLAVMVTLDSVSAEAITQLRTVYDYIFPVSRIRNDHPANLYLMDRADLHSAFTKINLWKLTEFSKIVYIDADVVAYRAPDELFDIPEPFAAAPDIGWPDLFNTGVMVLTPNMGDYYAMMAMAERGVSFDGADQGLINMHFGDKYHRLSFTYNVTPSAHYQYIPAFRHFQSSINMAHFIGSEKPWFRGRDAPHGDGPFDEMVGKWWAVYDRHYRAKEPAPEAPPSGTEYVQYFTKGEFHPQPTHQQADTGEHDYQGYYDPTPVKDFHPTPSGHDQPGYHQHEGDHGHHEHHEEHHEYHESHEHHEHHESHGHHEHHVHHEDHGHHHEPHHEEETKAGTSGPDSTPPVSHFVSHSEPVYDSGTQAEARSEQQVSDHRPHHDGGAPPAEHKPEPRPVPMHSWDAQRQPPPADSHPEAMNFPSTHYEMSQDTAPFIPPERYPSPPRNMWYDLPKEPPAPATQPPPEIFPWERHRPPPSRSFAGDPPASASATEEPPSWSEHPEGSSVLGSVTTDAKSEPSTPTTPSAVRSAPSDPWTSFTRVNAWDEVPEIERYVEGLQGHRRGKSQGSTVRPGGFKSSGFSNFPLRGFKLTDFPTEAERPSLPVTPAPVRRQPFWSGGGAEAGEEVPRQLPEAEGVPTQSDWDPMERLQQLARRQTEVLMQKFGGSGGMGAYEGEVSSASHEIPSQPLPSGSEDVKLPAHVAQSAPGVLSPQPVKGEATTSILRNMGSGNFDSHLPPKSSIPEPSYSGPGAAWEKGGVIPERETPLLPTEEERDVLET